MSNSRAILMVYILLHTSKVFFYYDHILYNMTTGGHFQIILADSLIQLALIAIYSKGLNRFPGKDIVDIFGGMRKGKGIWLLAPFLIFFVLNSALHLRGLAEVVNTTVFTSTPNWAILFVLWSLSIYAALQGSNGILRFSVVVFVLFIPFVLFVIGTSLQRFEWNNILPLWDVDWGSYFDPSFSRRTYMFSSFLFVGLFTSETTLKFRSFFYAWLGTTLFNLLAVYIPLSVFSQETVSQFVFPFVESLDTIDIRWLVFDRITMFYLYSIVPFSIVHMATVLWVLGRLSKQMIGLKANHWALFYAVLGYVITIFIVKWETYGKVMDANFPLRFYSILFIPLLLLFYGKWMEKRGML